MKWIQLLFNNSLLIMLVLSFFTPFIMVRAQGEEQLSSDSANLTATPTATPDFINIPELPENPSQVDLGRNSFWYNCMPCHGDHGQGLTDAWRMTWPEDHRGCWDRGCHGGRLEDQGFPIPKYVPPLFDSSYMQARFPAPDALFGYLNTKHPPQSPGSLEEHDYWALTAFMLFETGQVSEEIMLGPVHHEFVEDKFDGIFTVGLSLLLSIISGLWLWTRSQLRKLDPSDDHAIQ